MFFCSPSGSGTPFTCNGNEIQKVWEIDACWPDVRAKVRVERDPHAEMVIEQLKDCEITLFPLLT